MNTRDSLKYLDRLLQDPIRLKEILFLQYQLGSSTTSMKINIQYIPAFSWWRNKIRHFSKMFRALKRNFILFFFFQRASPADASKPKSSSRQRITDGRASENLLKIAGCVTPARRVFARFTLAAKENERNGGGRRAEERGNGPSTSRRRRPLRSAPASRHAEDSKKVRRGRLNSRRELRRASLARTPFSFAVATDRRAYRSRSPSPQRRRRNNISPGAVARRENRSCRDGESVRNGPARPRLSRRRIKKERSGTTKCRLTRRAI